MDIFQINFYIVIVYKVILPHVWVTIYEVVLVIGIIEILQLVTTNIITVSLIHTLYSSQLSLLSQLGLHQFSGSGFQLWTLPFFWGPELSKASPTETLE
jgi:hypothetical protein